MTSKIQVPEHIAKEIEAEAAVKQEEKRKAQEAQMRARVDRERIETQEDIADLRDDTARARLEQQARFKMLDLQNRK